jgi:RNA polymerase sigma-54 factor
MKLGQQLNIKQNQSLIMTPQLQQAIKLLQLTNIELSDVIEKAQLENPFLKENSPTITKKNVEEKNSNTYENMNSSVDPLKIDNKLDLENTFDTHISSNSIMENKKLFDKEVIRSGSITSAGEVIEKTLKHKVSLREHLINQINLTFKNNHSKSIAIAMIDYLHPSGWFISSICEVAKELNVEISIVEKTLSKLKNLEPIGIFSQNLAECLKIQLVENKKFNQHFETLLENLSMLPSGKFRQISKLCKVSEDKLFKMIKILRSLNPKPADAFNQENTNVDQPDIIVTRSAKGWRIDLNGSTLPSVNVDECYIEEMNNYNLDEKGSAFALEKIGEARWLKKAVDQRNKTILKVTSEILKKQVGFFRHGFSHMKPMILKDISDKIGMHESTVSRVTNSKLILTEWGVMPLKNFFSASISGAENSEIHAASAVRETIKN